MTKKFCDKEEPGLSFGFFSITKPYMLWRRKPIHKATIWYKKLERSNMTLKSMACYWSLGLKSSRSYNCTLKMSLYLDSSAPWQCLLFTNSSISCCLVGCHDSWNTGLLAIHFFKDNFQNKQHNRISGREINATE